MLWRKLFGIWHELQVRRWTYLSLHWENKFTRWCPATAISCDCQIRLIDHLRFKSSSLSCSYEKIQLWKNPAMKKWPKKMRRMNVNMNIRTQRYPIPTTYITRVLHPFQMFFVGQTMSSGKEAIAAVWYSWGYSWYCESTDIQDKTRYLWDRYQNFFISHCNALEHP